MTRVRQRDGSRPSFAARARYRFDSAISRGTASWYVRGRAPFARVVAAARARGEIAIGYRADGDDGNLPRVHLNPPKSETIELGAGDQVVVIAPV
jgi:hypothetical protein